MNVFAEGCDVMGAGITRVSRQELRKRAREKWSTLTTQRETWQAVPSFHTSATSRSMTAVAQAHMNMNMYNTAQASAWSSGDDVKREA